MEKEKVQKRAEMLDAVAKAGVMKTKLRNTKAAVNLMLKAIDRIRRDYPLTGASPESVKYLKDAIANYLAANLSTDNQLTALHPFQHNVHYPKDVEWEVKWKEFCEKLKNY